MSVLLPLPSSCDIPVTDAYSLTMEDVENASLLPPVLSPDHSKPSLSKQYPFSHSVTSSNSSGLLPTSPGDIQRHTRSCDNQENMIKLSTTGWSEHKVTEDGNIPTSGNSPINMLNSIDDIIKYPDEHTARSRDKQAYIQHSIELATSPTAGLTPDATSTTLSTISFTNTPSSSSPSNFDSTTSTWEPQSDIQTINYKQGVNLAELTITSPSLSTPSSSFYYTTTSARDQVHTAWSSADESGRSVSLQGGAGALDLTVRPAQPTPKVCSPEDRSVISALLEMSHPCSECSFAADTLNQLGVHFNKQHAVHGRCDCICGQGYNWLPDLLKHRYQCAVYRRCSTNPAANGGRQLCSPALQNGDPQLFAADDDNHDDTKKDMEDQLLTSLKREDLSVSHGTKRASQYSRSASIDDWSSSPIKHMSCQNCHRAGFATIGDYLAHSHQCGAGNKLKLPNFMQTTSGDAESKSGEHNLSGKLSNNTSAPKQTCSRPVSNWPVTDGSYSTNLRSVSSTLGPNGTSFDATRLNRFQSMLPSLGLNTLMKSAGYPMQAINYHNLTGGSCHSEVSKIGSPHGTSSRMSEMECPPRGIRPEIQCINSSVPATSSAPVSIANGTDLTRPFKCCHCIKAFKSKALLDQHMHIHYPPKYTCRYCAKKYRWPPVFYHHQRTCKKRPLTTTNASTPSTVSVTSNREHTTSGHHVQCNPVSNSGRYNWGPNGGANYSSSSMSDLSFTFSPASSICFPPLVTQGGSSSAMSESKQHGSPLIAPTLLSTAHQTSSSLPVAGKTTLPLASYFSLPPSFNFGIDPFTTPTTSAVLAPPSFGVMDLLHSPASLNWAALTAAAMTGLRLPCPPGAMPSPLMLGNLPPPPLGFHTGGLHLPSAAALYHPFMNASGGQLVREDPGLNAYHGAPLPGWLPHMPNNASQIAPADLMNSTPPSLSSNKLKFMNTDTTSSNAIPLQTTSTASSSEISSNLESAGDRSLLACICGQRFSEMPVYLTHVSTCSLLHHILLSSTHNNNIGGLSPGNPRKEHRAGEYETNAGEHSAAIPSTTCISPTHYPPTLRGMHLANQEQQLDKPMSVDEAGVDYRDSMHLVTPLSRHRCTENNEVNKGMLGDQQSTKFSQFTHLWKDKFPITHPDQFSNPQPKDKRDDKNSIYMSLTNPKMQNAHNDIDIKCRERLGCLKMDWDTETEEHEEGESVTMKPEEAELNVDMGSISSKHLKSVKSELQLIDSENQRQHMRQAQSLPFWLSPYMRSFLPQTSLDMTCYTDGTETSANEDQLHHQHNPTSSLMAAMATVLANAAAAAGFQYPAMTDLSQPGSNNPAPTADYEAINGHNTPPPTLSSSLVSTGNCTTSTSLARLCQLCGKEFSSRLSLKQHVEGKHSAEGKYQCPGCAKRYRWGASYYYHKKSCPAVRNCTTPSSMHGNNDFCLPLGLLQTPDDSSPPTPFPSPIHPYPPSSSALPSVINSFLASGELQPPMFGSPNPLALPDDQDVLFDLSKHQQSTREATHIPLDEAHVDTTRPSKNSPYSSNEASTHGSSPEARCHSTALDNRDFDFRGYQRTSERILKLDDACMIKDRATLQF